MEIFIFFSCQIIFINSKSTIRSDNVVAQYFLNHHVFLIWQFVQFRPCLGSSLWFLISNAVLIGSWKDHIFISPLWYHRLHNKNNQLLSYQSSYYWPSPYMSNFYNESKLEHFKYIFSTRLSTHIGDIVLHMFRFTMYLINKIINYQHFFSLMTNSWKILLYVLVYYMVWQASVVQCYEGQYIITTINIGTFYSTAHLEFNILGMLRLLSELSCHL